MQDLNSGKKITSANIIEILLKVALNTINQPKQLVLREGVASYGR